MSSAQSVPFASAFRPPLWVRVGLFALAYLLCAVLGSALSLRPGPFVTFWLPSGLFVGVLLFHERKYWLSFILAACLANTAFDLHNGQALRISLLFFTGNCLEAMAGAWLVQQYVGEHLTFSTLREVVGFTVFGALVGPTISATIGAGVVSYLLKAGTYWSTWLLWASGDALGIFLLTPLMISWRKRFQWLAWHNWSRRSAQELLFFSLIGLGALYIFNTTWHHDLALNYLMIPVVMFAAFRFGLRGTTMASLLTAVIAAWMTAHGHGNLSSSGLPLREQSIGLQLFMVVVTSCGLISAALLAERELVEGRLRELHQFNEQVIRSAREGIIVYGPDLRYQVWNPYMEEVSGIPAEEVLGRRPLEVAPFLQEVGVMDQLARALRGEVLDAIEYQVKVPGQAESTWVSDTSAPIRSANGEIIGVIGTVANITERKRIEEARLESEARLKKAQKVAHLGSWTWNIKTDHLDWSDEMYRIFGIERDSFRGVLTEVVAQAVHPDDRAAVEQSNRQVTQEGRPIPMEYRVVRPDGTVRHVWGEAGELFVDEDGQPALLTGIVQDITERKEAELSLQWTRFSVDRASDAMFWITPEAHIVDANEAACRSLGYAREELLKLTVPDVDPYYNVERWQGHFAELRERGTLVFESEQRKRDGRLFPVEIVANYVEFGGEERNCAFVRDITERRHAEEEKAKLQSQLIQSQKMESLGSLAGGVAHDMNNILGAILGMATANLPSQAPDSPTYRGLDTIIQAATRGGKMVKSLLSFSRQSPVEELELDINQVLREEAQMLEHTTLAKVRLMMDLASDLRPVRGDASALTHAFMNLCVNAVDAMPGNGVLTLRTRNLDDDWIEVMVEDTGVGMSREILEKAMDPFFTTKEVGKGTGLGLSLVYQTVKAHKGQLEIQSEAGRGTRVRMRFPAQEPLLRKAGASPARSADTHLAPTSVLLVDDDELVQAAMEALLGVLGHDVTATRSGEEALAKLEGGFQPDIVILDMNMPGLGGAGTLPRLRALKPTLPVLLATGRIDQFALDLAGAYPAVALLSKPFSLEELQHHIEAFRKPV